MVPAVDLADRGLDAGVPAVPRHRLPRHGQTMGEAGPGPGPAEAGRDRAGDGGRMRGWWSGSG